MHDLPLLLLATVILIYMIMAILYEDFIHPVTILTALPLAVFGALLVLCVFRQELNLSSFVGLILLVGLVKKNGIMLVDFALEHLRGQGQGEPSPNEESGNSSDRQPADSENAVHAAMLEACMTRFRPIMMTTLAALLGTLPIALGVGAGAESRRPLGIAVVGGLAFSQMLTLYITPALFIGVERLRQRRDR